MNENETLTAEACEDTCAPRDGYGWHSRGYLPHFESGSVTQMVTYRLADSLPRHVAERLAEEADTAEGDEAYRERIDAWLDAGHGECLLRRPAIAELVEDSLRAYDGVRYEIHAWVIMPNHVHILVRMKEPYLLCDAVKGWESYTARKINERLGRSGTVWQKEYWDRFIRNERHYERAVAYIRNNPEKAGCLGARVSSPASLPEIST